MAARRRMMGPAYGTRTVRGLSMGLRPADSKLSMLIAMASVSSCHSGHKGHTAAHAMVTGYGHKQRRHHVTWPQAHHPRWILTETLSQQHHQVQDNQAAR